MINIKQLLIVALAFIFFNLSLFERGLYFPTLGVGFLFIAYYIKEK